MVQEEKASAAGEDTRPTLGELLAAQDLQPLAQAEENEDVRIAA